MSQSLISALRASAPAGPGQAAAPGVSVFGNAANTAAAPMTLGFPGLGNFGQNNLLSVQQSAPLSFDPVRAQQYTQAQALRAQPSKAAASQPAMLQVPKDTGSKRQPFELPPVPAGGWDAGISAMTQAPTTENARNLNLASMGGMNAREAKQAMQEKLGILSGRALRGDTQAQQQRDAITRLWADNAWDSQGSDIGEDVWKPAFEKATGSSFSDFVFDGIDPTRSITVGWGGAPDDIRQGTVLDTRKFEGMGMPGSVFVGPNERERNIVEMENQEEGRDTIGRTMGIVPGQYENPVTQEFVRDWNRDNPTQQLGPENYMQYYIQTLRDPTYRPGVAPPAPEPTIYYDANGQPYTV